MLTPAFWISVTEYEHCECLCNILFNDYTTLLMIEYLGCLQTLPNIWKYYQRLDFQEKNY